MKALIQSAFEVQQFLRKNNWQFSFIGGIAIQRWGEPRLTRDMHLTLLTGYGDEQHFIDRLAEIYDFRISDGKKFAIKNRVLLLKTRDGIGIDIALGALPYEERLILRSSDYMFQVDLSLLSCSAEDLIITKAFADRDQDWLDIRGILIRQEGKLDWQIIDKELSPLCRAKEKPEIIQRLHSERQSVQTPND